MLIAIIHRNLESEEAPQFLTLPASRWDALEALARLEADSFRECFFEFESPYDVPQAGRYLNKVSRGEKFFHEVNYFAHRLTGFSHSDRILLNGAIAIHEPQDMKTMINLTWHLNEIVMTEAVDNEQLGRFLVENDMVEFAEEVLPYLDYAKVGATHMENTPSAIDHGIYYEDLHPEIAELYDGGIPPQLPDRGIFQVIITRSNSDHPSAELTLPTTQVQLDAALKLIGTELIDEIKILRGHSRIERFAPVFEQAVDLALLDNLAAQISDMSDDTYIKYLAVLEKEHPYFDLASAQDCARRLDEYSFEPSVRKEDIGSFGLIQYVGQPELALEHHTPELGGM